MKIGWGTCNITPQGGALSLAGQFHVRIATEVLDPLFTTAMVITSENTTAIWVSVDTCQIFKCLTDSVVAELAKRIPSFDPGWLMLCATHIHTGPHQTMSGWLSLTGDMQDEPGTLPSVEVTRQMTEGIVAAVMEAMDNQRAAYMKLAIAPVVTGVNRRVVYKDGSVEMYGDIHRKDFYRMEGRDGGPAQLLYVYDAETNELVGLVTNIPCTAQCDEMANYVTADYWATTRRILREQWGKDLQILSLCRAAGDLSPHAMVDRYDDEKTDRSARKAREKGEWVAQFIQWFRERTICRLNGDIVAHASNIVRLPFWKVSEEEYNQSKHYLADPNNFKKCGQPKNSFDFANAWTRVRRVEKDPKFLEARLNATRIDNICLYSTPFELYTSYADRIRAQWSKRVLFDVQLSYDSLGYLPTREAVAGGHYSANIFNGTCDPDGGEVLIRECTKIIGELFGERM